MATQLTQQVQGYMEELEWIKNRRSLKEWKQKVLTECKDTPVRIMVNSIFQIQKELLAQDTKKQIAVKKVQFMLDEANKEMDKTKQKLKEERKESRMKIKELEKQIKDHIIQTNRAVLEWDNDSENLKRDKIELQQKIKELEQQLKMNQSNTKQIQIVKCIQMERDNLQKQYNYIKMEKDKLQKQYNWIKMERDNLQKQYNYIKMEMDKLQKQYNWIKMERDNLQKQCESILSQSNNNGNQQQFVGNDYVNDRNAETNTNPVDAVSNAIREYLDYNGSKAIQSMDQLLRISGIQNNMCSLSFTRKAYFNEYVTAFETAAKEIQHWIKRWANGSFKWYDHDTIGGIMSRLEFDTTNRVRILGKRNGYCTECMGQELACYHGKERDFDGKLNRDKCDDVWCGNGWFKLWMRFKNTRNALCHGDRREFVAFNKVELMEWWNNAGYINGPYKEKWAKAVLNQHLNQRNYSVLNQHLNQHLNQRNYSV